MLKEALEKQPALEARVHRAEYALGIARTFIESLGLGWLYWPMAKQPDPRVTAYESRTVEEIEEAGKQALKDMEKFA